MIDDDGPEVPDERTMDPELLARFVDGTLDPDERRGVLETLARSPADREVLADVIRELQEHPDDDGPEPTRRRPPRSYMLI